MLRIVHTADVHLGARHADMGDQAAAQRERQFAAFKATVDLAIEERVDLFLIAGDLFDSNTQPRRSADRVAAELARLAAAKVRTVIIPGTHDVYDRSSIYRAYDLEALAGSDADDDFVTVLTPARPWVHLSACDVVVFGPGVRDQEGTEEPAPGPRHVGRRPRRRGGSGWSTARSRSPARPTRDDVVITTEEIAASGLDYLALGHWHSAQQAKAGGVTYAYAGAPEPVAIDQDRAGKALLVELDTKAGAKTVTVTEKQVGKTRFDKARHRRRGDRQPAGLHRRRRETRRPRPRSRCADRSASARTSSTSTSTRSRPRSRRRSCGPRPRYVACRRSPKAPCRRRTRSRVRSSATSRHASPSSRRPAGRDEAAEARDVLRLGRLLLAGHEVTL